MEACIREFGKEEVRINFSVKLALVRNIETKKRYMVASPHRFLESEEISEFVC